MITPLELTPQEQEWLDHAWNAVEKGQAVIFESLAAKLDGHRLELEAENAELRQLLAYHEEPSERG